ncbi:MAG: HEAT repeat domain-containing protein [Myxococcota bacterium]|nr:HEAT repeat domain-containing protein [Myxococcota bacterium]MDW8362832.1 HEAT repeat domain-containing protein [Myxococcales bacterium]
MIGETRRLLTLGLGAAGSQQLAQAGLPPDLEDRIAARRLVEREAAVAASLQAVVEHEAPQDGSASAEAHLASQAAATADGSLLGRLGVAGARGLDTVTDVRTLAALARAGSLVQRRAAIERLRRLLEAPPRGLDVEVLRAEADALSSSDDVEVAFELEALRIALGGPQGRVARAERDAFVRLAMRLVEAVGRYWDGQLADEPVGALGASERAALLLRARDLPDAVVDHVAALVEGADPAVGPARRYELVAALRDAGEPRLVPALLWALASADRELVMAAARALSSIDDPRVAPALSVALERTASVLERVVVAGALARAGDGRGLAHARSALDSTDASERLAALEALGAAGRSEDTDAVAAHALAEDVREARAALRALGRLGDARAVPVIERVRASGRRADLVAEAEAALAAIRARLELRGESVAWHLASAVPSEPRVPLDLPPLAARLASAAHFVIGWLWMIGGAVERAVARFERAASRRPGWLLPLVRIAMTLERAGQTSRALSAFRRALETDRAGCEGNPIVIRSLVRAFLGRAEQLQREGRSEVAWGLLEEVLALDLRRAPAALRVELERRRDACAAARS